MPKAKVLIIDDSALMRQLLSELLGHDADLEVVGVAGDPYIAWDKIKKLSPDVLTLDVEMPRMDGLTFLQKLMHAHPLPVVMISSLTEKGCETTLRALELGAVDFVAKPKIDVSTATVEMADEIIAKIKTAIRARGRLRPRVPSPLEGETRRPGDKEKGRQDSKEIRTIGIGSERIRPQSAAPPLPFQRGSEALIKSTHQVVAIGASTGGTEAVREVLVALPADAPGVVAVLHMPENFTKSYAQRLDSLCQVRVREARDGDLILPGHALIAPGNYHLQVRRSGASYVAQVVSGERVNRHRPSVDVLFHSCARYLGRNAVGVILTGMGDDGARGLLAMRQAGARTLAQDEASCVVFGMPREAIALGAAEEVISLDRIAGRILSLVGRP